MKADSVRITNFELFEKYTPLVTMGGRVIQKL